MPKDSPVQDSHSKVKSKVLDFQTFVYLIKALPLGLLLADTPKDFQQSIKIALFKILTQRLKVKCLTFRHFYTKFLAQINLIKAWSLGMLLAEMPRRFSTTYLNSPDKYFLPKSTEKCLIAKLNSNFNFNYNLS